MSSYFETIPEDLLFTISLYLEQYDLIEIYNLYKPRLYDKLSFWYTKYDLEFLDVDWKDLVVDQTKNKFFQRFYINYIQFEKAYNEAKSWIKDKPESISTRMTKDGSSYAYDIQSILSIPVDTINKLDLINPNFDKDIDDKLFGIIQDGNESIFYIHATGHTLGDYTFDDSNLFDILYDPSKNIYYISFIAKMFYEISYKQVMTLITYIFYEKMEHQIFGFIKSNPIY